MSTPGDSKLRLVRRALLPMAVGVLGFLAGSMSQGRKLLESHERVLELHEHILQLRAKNVELKTELMAHGIGSGGGKEKPGGQELGTEHNASNREE